MRNNTKTILIVDDDPDIATMIRIVLEYHDYAVVLALPDPDKIQALLQSRNFDLLIMDMLLSGVSGMDICAAIKKDTSLSHIPILMISAHPNAHELSKKAAADDFIAKPFDVKDLLYKIDLLVNKEYLN